MTNEEWDELLALRNKASLGLEPDHGLSELEQFVSYLYCTRRYSDEESERLMAQYAELSSQERQELTARAKHNANRRAFHLSDEDIDRLKTARSSLSFHDRARLSDRFVTTPVGTAWMDLGDVCKAEIEICDNGGSSKGDLHPHAHISCFNGYERRVETVDIIESVKRNPFVIGHPAIVFAIQHWQRVFSAKRFVKRVDVASHDKLTDELKELIGGVREVEDARRNLIAISKALFDGANEQAIPKESALALKMKSMGLELENKTTLVYAAWTRLKGEFVDQNDDEEQTKNLQGLKDYLLAFSEKPYIEDSRSRTIPVETVIDFLAEDGRKGGKRFIGYDEEGRSLRPAWKVFRNAFASWLFNLEQPVLQGYLEAAARQPHSEQEVYQTSMPPRRTVAQIWQHTLSTELVAVGKPVMLNETAVSLLGIEEAIERASLAESASSEGN